jgi:hypothetical protein
MPSPADGGGIMRALARQRTVLTLIPSPRIACKFAAVCYANPSWSTKGYTRNRVVRTMSQHLRGVSTRWWLPGVRQTIGYLLAWSLALGFAPCPGAAPESNLVAVDFDNVELRVFIKFVSEVTGKVFLVDDRVRGQVSVRFANKIPIDQLHDVLESVLEIKGFTAIPAGPITKIVPLGTAKQRGIEVRGSRPSAPGSGR